MASQSPRGTEGSNLAPSSAESGANRDWHFFELSQRGHAGLIRHESLPARRSITVGLLTGTEGSNPVPSSRESSANPTLLPVPGLKCREADGAAAGAPVDPPSRRSRLDADHPENGIRIQCRFTADLANRGRLRAMMAHDTCRRSCPCKPTSLTVLHYPLPHIRIFPQAQDALL
jgi:hypothetical protein